MKTSVKLNRFIISGILILAATVGYGQQKADTALYAPQISLTASNGFGPYIIGDRQDNLIMADKLPESTSKVTFRFLDIDGDLVGEEHVQEGANLTSASWNVALDSLDLPLSPSLNVELIYSGDSLAEYYIPYAVYPDTMVVESTHGWESFISNAYPFSDTLWQPVPGCYTTFTAKRLPPRTDKVIFYLLSELTVIDSLYVCALPGMYMDSATWEDFRLDELPLSAKQLKVVAFCHGGADRGISIEKELLPTLQEARLTCITEEITLIDSIPPAIQNQTEGHVLLVDSTKYMAVTNMPGANTFDSKMGSYSYCMFRWWSIESWIKLDLEKIMSGSEGDSMTFMKVDSVWSIVIKNLPQQSQVKFILYSLFQPDLDIAYAYIGYEAFQGVEWHHLALTCNLPPVTFNFYFDGEPVESWCNYYNLQYLGSHASQYLPTLKTQPLTFGGCNAVTQRKSSDLSLITSMDEIRMWNIAMSPDYIKNNFSKPVLQSDTLIGYWNFNDLNCNGNNVSDLSYQCNHGLLNNGATLIDQYPGVQKSIDTLIFQSSNALTDSVGFSFIDKNNSTVDSIMVYPENGFFTLHYDIEALPYRADLLKTTEYFSEYRNEHSTSYNLTIYPPMPIATIHTGWGNYYTSSLEGCSQISDTGILFNPVTVSGLPPRTQKLTMGWQRDASLVDTISYTGSTNPYHHFLTLNGTDNYIVAIDYGSNASIYFTMAFWFKTTTDQGGIMAGFTWPSPKPGGRLTNGPYIKMKKDGAIEYYVPIDTSLVTLYASNKFNDGEWHHLAFSFDGKYTNTASLYIDGTLTDKMDGLGSYTQFQSKFCMGINIENKADVEEDDRVAEYFQGSFSEVAFWRNILDYKSINRQMYFPASPEAIDNDMAFYYMMDEGLGDTLYDATWQHLDALLMGSSQKWYKENQFSFATWTNNMIDKPAGEYTFFARVYYYGGPDTGISYPLGRISIKDPVEGYSVTYNLQEGNGYFDEGTIVNNVLKLWTNYDRNGAPSFNGNRINMFLKDPCGEVIDASTFFYMDDEITFFDTLDMGDVLTGSYIMLQYGYDSVSATDITYKIDATNIFPIFTRTIIPPKVTGDFGPFDQAIAPETMVHMNRFKIITEVYDELDSVMTKFYNNRGELVADTIAHKQNNTTWFITYDMATLSPPVTYMKIEYFLGQNPIPALVQGPFHIKIIRTRPFWFDYLGNDAFSDVEQSGDSVTFRITTPLDDNLSFNSTCEVKIDNFIPLIGGSSCKIETPTADAYLRYYIPDYKLAVDDVEFYNKIFNLGAGSGSMVRFSFENEGDASYYLDDQNNLIAVQNFSTSGKITSPFRKIQDIAEKIKDLMKLASAVNPESALVQPTFSITFSVAFDYAGRKHLMVDTISKDGSWGSVGNLDVVANPAGNTHAYQNSASYNFYSAAVGANFAVGVELLEGLVEADFCVTLRFDIGLGKSYVTIPHYRNKLLKSFGVDIYGKAEVKALWGLYEKTVWGPKLFYSKILWGDDMSDCFPPMDKGTLNPFSIPANGSNPDLGNEIMPVSWFNKMPLAYPQASIVASDNYQLFTWVERGDQDGERKIRTKYLDRSLHKFSDDMTIENNNHLINGPFAESISDKDILLTWAQTRYTDKTLLQVKNDDIIKAFAESQDIWFAVFDIETDSLLQMEMLPDNTRDTRSGRAEAKPVITTLSDTKALITWQVANLETHIADIWYVELNKEGGVWSCTSPQLIAESDGIETNLRIASPEEDMAVLVWLNTSNSDTVHNEIQTAVYSDGEWGNVEVLANDNGHFYNFLSMGFNNNIGALIFTTFVQDPSFQHYESLSLLPWDYINKSWSTGMPDQLLIDSLSHLQYPCISIRDDGATAIAVKIEEMIPKTPDRKISQVDLLTGDLSNTWTPLNHYVANEYICDTTKQVSGLAVSFIGQDTLMILSHEYVMSATNTAFQPVNGVFLGDTYMNLVLRSFKVQEDNTVLNIDESNYFLGINEPVMPEKSIKLYQNFPNPASGQTTIKFEIPETSETTLELFDMTGYRVATLIDLRLPAGEYSFDLNTNQLMSGSYICLLYSCGTVAEITIIVIR